MDATSAVVHERIRLWMHENIISEGYLRFVDLHVDQIDPGLEHREKWLTGSLRCLEAAVAVREAHEWPFLVAIGMSLQSQSLPQGANFDTLREVENQLDWSPPSLYLFSPASAPWASDREFQELGSDFRVDRDFPTRTYFREWFDENDEEYRRSLWIVG